MPDPIPSDLHADPPPVPPPVPVIRGVTWMLLAKAAALLLLYLLFFSPAHRPQVTSGRVADALLAPPARSAAGAP